MFPVLGFLFLFLSLFLFTLLFLLSLPFMLLTVTNPLYQWPTSYPPVSGYVLSSTTAGVLTWEPQIGGGAADIVDGRKFAWFIS